MSLFNKLIRNNSGISSKNFYLVCSTIISVLLLLVPVVALFVEVIANKRVESDLMGWSTYIGAVGAFAAAAGITKAYSEKNENREEQ